MSRFKKEEYAKEARLRQHLFGLRQNQVSVALIVLALHGYEVELHYMGEPNAPLAKEILDSLEEDSTPIWSCSTKAGGFWETWQRYAMKTGELGDAWDTYRARMGL